MRRSLASACLVLAVAACTDQAFVTDVPLRVVAVSPAGEAVDAAREARIVITFSEKLQQDSVAGAFKVESLGFADAPTEGVAVDFDATYSDDPVPTVTLTPRAPLPFSTGFKVTIATSLKRSRDSGPLPVEVTFRFRTLHPPMLRVERVEPGEAAGGVPRDATIRVVFSEPVRCETLQGGNAVLVEAYDPHPHTAEGGPTRTLAGSWDCPVVEPSAAETLDGKQCAGDSNRCVVTFKPEDPTFLLRYSSHVTLTLKGGLHAEQPIESARATPYGGQLPAIVTTTFHVVDPPSLSLVASIPGADAEAVARDSGLLLSFSEPVDCAAFAAGLVKVEETFDAHPRLGARAATVSPVPGVWACATAAPDERSPAICATKPELCRATFTPETGFLFEWSSRVAVTLPGGAYAADVAPAALDRVQSARATSHGGVLPATSTFTFLVVAPPPQRITSTVPGLGSFGVKVLPADIVVSLSEPIACATVNATTVTSSVTLADGTAGTYGFTLSCTEGETSFRLQPQDPAVDFPYSAQFSFLLRGGSFGEQAPAAYPGDAIESTVATTRGGQLLGDYSFGFRTEDPPPLLVKASSPSAGGEGVVASAPVDVVFTQPVACASVTGQSFQVLQRFATPEDPARTAPAPAAVACSFTCPSGTDPAAVRCDHAAFAPSASVEVTLAGGTGFADSIRSVDATVSGGFLAAPPVVFSFRAADPAPLTVTGTVPNGNPGNHVSANTDVRFTFDRAVRCATTTGHFTLFDETAGVEIPGVLACTDGTAVGPSVNGNVLIFTPQAALVVEHTYRATASAGIVAADATVVGAVVHGQLPADVSARFVVAHEDLRIVTTSPLGGASLTPIGTLIALRFNQDLSAPTLVPCTPSVQTGCNFWVNEGTVPDSARAIDLALAVYDNQRFEIRFDPSDPANAPSLQPDKTYSVRVRGGLAGPLGANGVSRLPADYTWTFTTSSTSLITGIDPGRDATGVDVTAPVCVEFVDSVRVPSLTSGGIQQLTLQYTDAFGRSAQLPLDATTPYLISDRNGVTGNLVCLNLSAAPTPCYAGERRLLYGRQYTVTVSTAVEIGASASRLSSAFSWSFQTRQPPELSEIRIKNAVIDEVLEAGASEVPVNAAFAISFAEPMDPASFTGNIAIAASGTSQPVAATITAQGADARIALVSLSPAMDYLDAAAGKGEYALVLKGGVGGVATAKGNPLADDVRIAFRTSPATRLLVSPPEAQITPMIYIPVTSMGRDLHLASLTSESVYGSASGVRIAGLIAQHATQRRSVTYVANPTFLGSQPAIYRIHTTDRVLDYRGNPVPAATSRLYSSGNTPSAQAIQASLATAADVAFSGNGAPSFTLTIPYQTNLRGRMIGTSYNAAAPGDPDGTISLEAAGGAGCPAAGTRLALTVQPLPVEPTEPLTTPDRVRIEVAGPPYLQRGCGYTLKIRQHQTANVYNQSPGTDGCGGGAPPTDIISDTTCAAGASPGMTFVGETTAPTLSLLEVQRPDGSWMPAGGAAGVSGGTEVRATFSEPIDPASVNATSFALSGGAGGSFAVVGNTVTLKLAAHLSAGTSCTITLGALTDLAGNPFAGATASFSVESAIPTFDSVSFDATPGREWPFGQATLQFSEPIDAATLTVNAATALGSVSPQASGAPLFGCATRDPADPRRILWRPAAALAAGTEVTVTVNPAAATVALSDLAGTPVVETVRSFTP